MADKQFIAQLTDAYEHIYDIVYLRNHPLIDILAADKSISRKDLAWQIHHLLLDTINELDPGPQAPTFSREWRRHRLMVLHYIDGLSPQVVADQLAISRRHFYREHEGAIEALANILWRRAGIDQMEPLSADAQTEAQPDGVPTTITDRMELMRLEAAHLAQIDQRTRLPEVMSGVVSLLEKQAQQHNVTIHLLLNESTPDVLGDRRLIRQLLMGLIGHLINVTQDGPIALSTHFEVERLLLRIEVLPETKLVGSIIADSQTPITVFDELATLSLSELHLLVVDSVVRGFTVELPIYTGQQLILVVDDNADILELFTRFLKPQNYEVIATQVSKEVPSLAQSMHPSVIILDLMMPDQDGWDLLQILLNQPETHKIPILVCSVLRQRELALSLGATAFLEKPVSEEKLLSIIKSLAP